MLAFELESEVIRQMSAFVVSAEDCYSIAVPELEGYEEGDGLDRVVASVDVITHEEVVGVGRVAADAEQF